MQTAIFAGRACSLCSFGTLAPPLLVRYSPNSLGIFGNLGSALYLFTWFSFGSVVRWALRCFSVSLLRSQLGWLKKYLAKRKTVRPNGMAHNKIVGRERRERVLQLE